MQQALQRLALEARDQVRQFPPHVVAADELALDLGHWTDVCRAWRYVDGELLECLGALDEPLGRMSGPEQAERWTENALLGDAGWQRARSLAREALDLAGWPPGVPPGPESGGTTWGSRLPPSPFAE